MEGLLVCGDLCTLGRKGGMCSRRGLKLCPSLVVGGGHFYRRYVSPAVRAKISNLLFGFFLFSNCHTFFVWVEYDLCGVCVIQ